jgi:hypothetical protein
MSAGVSTDVERWTCQARRTRAGAHRGGGATVGWWREFGVTAVDCGESPDGGRRCSEALPWLYKSEGEVRAKPKWEKWGGGSMVASLTSERGRHRWRGRISGEGQCSDSGGGRKSNKEGGFTRGVLRR